MVCNCKVSKRKGEMPLGMLGSTEALLVIFAAAVLVGGITASQNLIQIYKEKLAITHEYTVKDIAQMLANKIIISDLYIIEEDPYSAILDLKYTGKNDFPLKYLYFGMVLPDDRILIARAQRILNPDECVKYHKGTPYMKANSICKFYFNLTQLFDKKPEFSFEDNIRIIPVISENPKEDYIEIGFGRLFDSEKTISEKTLNFANSVILTEDWLNRVVKEEKKEKPENKTIRSINENKKVVFYYVIRHRSSSSSSASSSSSGGSSGSGGSETTDKKPSISIEKPEDGKIYLINPNETIAVDVEIKYSDDKELNKIGMKIQGPITYEINKNLNLKDFVLTTSIKVNKTGDYSLCAYAKDSGNHEVNKCISFKVREKSLPINTPPQIIIHSPEDGGIYEAIFTKTFGWIANIEIHYVIEDDDGIKVPAEANGKTRYEYDNVKSYGLGDHEFCVYAEDMKGLSNKKCVKFTVVAKSEENETNSPPNIAIYSPEDGKTYIAEEDGTAIIEIHYLVTDPDGLVKPVSGTTRYEYKDKKVYNVGKHEFCVYAEDTKGATSSKCVNFEVQTQESATAPVITINEPEENGIYLANYVSGVGIVAKVPIDYEISDNYGLVKPDAAKGKKYYHYTGSEYYNEGVHKFCVYAENIKGKTSEECNTFQVVHHNVNRPPQITIYSPSENEEYKIVDGQDSVDILIHYVIEDDDGIKVPAEANGKTRYEYEKLRKYTAGSHEFCVYAEDMKGLSNKKCVHFVVKDVENNEPPKITIYSPEEGQIYLGDGKTAKVYVHYLIEDEDGLTEPIEAAGKTRYEYEGYKYYREGTHTFCVKATDAYAESSTRCVTFKVQIINEPPQIIINEPENGMKYKASYIPNVGVAAKVLIDYEVSDDDGLVKPVSGKTYYHYSSYKYYGIGNHEFCVYAEDTKGATSSKCVNFEVFKDAPNAPPQIKINSPINGKTYETTGTTATIKIDYEIRDNDGIKSPPIAQGKTYYHYTGYRDYDIGNHEFCVYAEDMKGATNEKCVSFTVEGTPEEPNYPPSIIINSPVDKQTYRANTYQNGHLVAAIRINYVVTDPDGLVEPTSGTTRYEVDRTEYFGLGSHTFCVHAKDTKGATSSKCVSFEVKPDIGPNPI